MSEILSRQNPRFKTWLSLLDAKGIKKAGLALVSGKKLVIEFLKQHPALVEDQLFTQKIGSTGVPAHVRNFDLGTDLFNELDVMGTHAPLLVVKTPALKPWLPGAPLGLELIAALSDPGNLGALLRSCEAFGVSRLILCAESCSPFLPKALRAGSGANFRVPLATTGSIMDLKIESGFCLDMNGEDLTKIKWPRDLYLVVGEEGRGIPSSLQLKAISIAMSGQVESLNATTSASVALFSYRSAHPLK